MKFIHSADIHLDSPLLDLERYEGAPVAEIRGATRRALENLVTLCLDEQAVFLLIAGDLYDGGWRDYNTGLFFAAQMRRLRDAGIHVYVIRGNHDAASAVAKQLRLPDNVTELPTGKPGTVLLEEFEVAIHGQGFARREAPDDLAVGYPEPHAGYVNIGLLHTSADGREGHDTYAPCTPAGLAAKHYEYWALGHVHQREVLSEKPWIVFPGNLQGRHARETGGKGATVVTVDGVTITSVEHRDLDVVRWVVCNVDTSAATSAWDVVDLLEVELRAEVERAEGRTLAVRVRLVGATAAHEKLVGDREQLVGEFRQIAADVGGAAVWVEKVETATTHVGRTRGAAPSEEETGTLLTYVAEARTEEGADAALAKELAELARRLPPELRDGPESLGLDNPRRVAALAVEAEDEVLARLLGGGAA